MDHRETDIILQHNCLYVSASIDKVNDIYQIIPYCMSESSIKWNIQKQSKFNKIFTFIELYQRQITIQHLYIWSSPIDLIERYQLFLDQIPHSLQTSLSRELFYNCSLPKFGSTCQYEFDFYHSDYLTLNEMIDDYYFKYKYKPNTLTCYIHLQCNRGPQPACLDWTEICDGKIDCLDGGRDEEYCWQLEINECEDNEYRCKNGQCIPFTFFRDEYIIPDCLDGSDEFLKNNNYSLCSNAQPTFQCEDILCGIRNHVSGLCLTSSCTKERAILLLQALFLNTSDSIRKDCLRALKCLINIPIQNDPRCMNFCQNGECTNIILETCPDVFSISNVPIMFGHVYFVYKKNDFTFLNNNELPSPYVCYNDTRCHGLFENDRVPLLNNSVCISLKNFNGSHVSGNNLWIHTYLIPIYKQFWKCNSMTYDDPNLCDRSNMYQCFNSTKCISIYRLGDGIHDCLYNDDEELDVINKTISLKRLPTFFKCASSDKYISYYLVENGRCDCGPTDDQSCDDEYPAIYYGRNHVSFQTICDGFTELLPILIDGQNHTDETECENWRCNNIYTRCNGIWNCLNGADEINCDSLPLINCSSSNHICVSPSTYQLICLPITKANDGIIDCLGATDEPKLCRSSYATTKIGNFYCSNDKSKSCMSHQVLCNGKKDCIHGEDVKACDTTRNFTAIGGICNKRYVSFRSNTEKVLCERLNDINKQSIVYFSLDTTQNKITNTIKQNQSIILPNSNLSIIPSINNSERYCHRGLDLRIWLDKSTSNVTCLCPPTYYGSKCQYQNQRVSLTLQFRALSDSWQIPFVIIILLIDNSIERQIHSYEQFTYLSIRDCQIKFHKYLFYSNRPKNNSNNYLIHIDIYEKISLEYRGSYLISIKNLFLPNYRLSRRLTIPKQNKQNEICSKHQCGLNGQCRKYLGRFNNTIFCQCKSGWTGKFCSIPLNCSCSLNSLCIGKSLSNQRSICICPLNKFGSKCLLNNEICQLNKNESCLNNGQCIPSDEYLLSKRKFTCICKKGFSGNQCEINDNEIILSFHNDIHLSQSILLHFIQINQNSFPKRSTTFKTFSSFSSKQNSINIYWSHPFHLLFIEIYQNKFYLAFKQNIYNQSTIINKTIESSDHCKHINLLFQNLTLIHFHLLKKIKFYHLLCQKSYSFNLSCFYDDYHICLCQQFNNENQANCFEFDHHMKLDCFGESGCENGAQCFQDSPICPKTSICLCPTCFYGRRCQFHTSRFGLSLDAVLGYKIQPNIRLIHQPVIVQVTIVLTILMTIIGIISSILSLITFKNKKLHEVGSGFYLLGTSVSTLLTMIMFALKFFILLGAQMESIVNRSFLNFQCLTIDFFLRICLNMDHWLNACVACERAITSFKATKFNKRKSRKAAKYVIFSLLIFMILTTIHDPIHRRLIDDTDEYGENKRVWCIVTYSSSLEALNSTLNIFHFFAPFFINLMSALIIIKSTAKQRAIIHPQHTHRQHLHNQFQKYIHLLIAPVLLVILALPRLIISLVSGCMKSIHNSWLFVLGYFISFIPPMLTFILYIVPTRSYKREFGRSVKYIGRKMRARVHPIS